MFIYSIDITRSHVAACYAYAALLLPAHKWPAALMFATMPPQRFVAFRYGYAQRCFFIMLGFERRAVSFTLCRHAAYAICYYARCALMSRLSPTSPARLIDAMPAATLCRLTLLSCLRRHISLPYCRADDAAVAADFRFRAPLLPTFMIATPRAIVAAIRYASHCFSLFQIIACLMLRRYIAYC